MDVLLCLKVHESTDTSFSATFSESLLKFTEYEIPPRIKFCNTHPYRPVDEMSHVKLGVPPSTDLPPELQSKNG